MAGKRTWNGRPFRLLRKLGPPSETGVSRFIRLVNRTNLCWLSYLPGWQKVAKNTGREWLIQAYDEWKKDD